jgi:ARG and Rhodanese-Phosphatase-superfamily-associated Protein domain
MTDLTLRPLAPLDLTGYRLGQPQRAGALTMVPVFGPAYPGIVPPRSGVKLARVDGYGRVVLANPGTSGVAVVPLHIGYVQDGAQNHALCRSAFLAAGQELLFPDACCVQASQGGYLAEREQWFFVLPVELRGAALDLAGQANYSKLWPAIAELNRRYRLPARGHLEQILTRQRATLTQYRSRLELTPGQLGALFFIADRLAGVEIAPDPRYFAEVWMALACFAYGVAAWHAPAPADPEPLSEVSTVDGLRRALDADRRAFADRVRGWLAQVPREPVELVEQERYLQLRLSTVRDDSLGGQVVTDGDRLVYASVFARQLA